MQAKFVEMLTRDHEGQLLALEPSRLKDEEELTPAQVCMIKRHNVHDGARDRAHVRDILGGNGITLEYPRMRHMCNLETVLTYEGTHDIHTLILGEHITGQRAI